MSEGYAWPPMGELSGDFLGYTADHLFGEIWNREGLSFRDRRLLLIGLLVGRGLHDVIDIQMEAALKNEELTESDLRESVILLAHYAGWPDGAKLNAAVEIGRAWCRERVGTYGEYTGVT